MPLPITRKRVGELVAAGAQLVEVLPVAEFDDEHLPDAVNLPLKRLERVSVEATLERGRAVVVYCWDAL